MALPRTLLVANRGEVAVRVIRACRELGIRAIAVHSTADAGAYWTRLADAAIEIGPAPVQQSYLDSDAIVTAAQSVGADTVHPGYGLLSESAPFAQAVRDAGMVFVGPDAATIGLMGDKVAACGAALASGVAVLPGSHAPVSDTHDALANAERLGWPIVVKASFGGGGRGLRVARTADDLAAAIEQAGREAVAAFGRAEIFLERYLDRPRHIEVQILADMHGNVAALGDRDCSVQRRHQKLMEEAPATGLRDDVRDSLHAAAIRLCRNVGYTGAGTVEFLLDGNGSDFFFLEMNTRLQVEHGVTEMVTGIDIVREQILIASGAELSFTADRVPVHGHAMQARIAAEDPWHDFRATPGTIAHLRLPGGPWLRCDFGFEAGDSVPVHYDSLLGKVHAWGRTRDEARLRLAGALHRTELVGVATTAAYLRSLLDQPAFVAAQHDTGSLEREWQPHADDRPQQVDLPASSAQVRSVREVRVPWGVEQTTIAIHGAAGLETKPLRADRGIDPVLTKSADGDAAVTAPMDGVVRSVDCATGAPVRKGEQILLIEAMKMEVVIAAPRDGIIERVLVTAGAVIRSGETLAMLAAA
jgi:acetyl-CoA/propionyl-CoA carboxylase biotin carboxyl carrier protein